MECRLMMSVRVTMRFLWFVLSLSLLYCCRGQEHGFMLLAGPLTDRFVKDLSVNHFDSQTSPLGASEEDVFICRNPLPQQTKDYFLYLKSRGVSHFKVPLSWSHILPTGDPSHPHEATVTCYKTLVQQLTESGIKPLLVLHRSTVPELLRTKYGGWENPELVKMFEQYAGFVFTAFKDLVDTFITFSHLHELHDEGQLQNALQSHANIYKLYHQMFKGGHVSIGLKATAADNIDVTVPADILALEIEFDCSSGSLTELLTFKARGKLPILLYKVNTKNCASVMDHFQPLTMIIDGLRQEDPLITGADITNLFEWTTKLLSRNSQQKQKRPRKDTNSLLMTEIDQSSRSSYSVVWDYFGSQSVADRDGWMDGSFPDGFQWSISSESFKVEGGWAEHGKGETIWDRFSHEGHVLEKQTTDVACDSYHKVDYDVYLLRGMQSPNYQFSVSWARIFPTGRKESLVEKGAAYYDNMINTLLQSGIEPTVTLHYWDLPQALQDQGGWTNNAIVEAFKEFADFCFSRYGDRVKTWNTFSSPWVMSELGEYPPSVKDPIVASYQVTHNILKSHAEAWHIYDEKYRKLQGGKVGIALNSEWAEPNNPSSVQDKEAAERYLNFKLGWFAHPIFVDGDYPAVLKDQIEKKKAECGTEVARLPVFTEAEKQRIQGTADFFGLNHHTSRLISESLNSCDPGPNNVGDFEAHIDPTWPTTASDQIQSVPWGLRRLLNYIASEYTSITKVPIYITGNGMPTEYSGDVLNDSARVDFLKTYINEAMKAVILDSVFVQRFTVQSLMDGFEGPQGYSQRFGLHYVNFEDPDRPRTPKISAYYYSKVIERNGFAESANLISNVQRNENKIKNTRLPSLPPSEVPSKAKVVWEKFSLQTTFQRKRYHYGTFPEGFQWGVSSSAYQVEGGWNADGKGPSIWDTFTQIPGNTPNDDNGNVACDSYNKIDEDLYMLNALEVKTYRFSLSWSRIFPTGYSSSLNQKGVDYYNKLIDGLIANNITPMVTLYHWDLPQALQDMNGWDNPEMINIFNEYCDFCYATFGDRVKFWITFNEPQIIAWSGYGLGQIPPNVMQPGDAPYKIAHNLLKAHAKAYHTYDEKYRAIQGGLVSISLNAEWAEPLDVNIPREVVAADRALQFQLGWFAHPIFKNGDYPDAMKWQVGNKSELQGLTESRLPSFTEEDKAYIQGTADVFCINSYTTKVVRHVTSRLSPESYQDDQDIGKEDASGSFNTAIAEQKAFPWGLRRLLNWIKEEYGDPDIYITGNGAATNDELQTDDTERIFFHKTYIAEALKAQNLDGVKVMGYIAYSLMDSFEWLNGYSLSFGLHYVDFNQLSRPRIPKRSAQFYHNIILDNGFPLTDQEKPIYGHFPEDFAWSVSTASFQVEGGWRADGKGLSIWDKFSHTPLKVGKDENGDIACDSYHKIDEDVDMLKQLKVNHYRFSISWSRVLPDGTTKFINEPGLNYYHRLIDALLAANIKPQVTLYHWDLPQALQDVGGWENDTVVQRFKEYADVIFSNLGDKVKFWITLNEPYVVANLGNGYGVYAPGIGSRPGTLPYLVGHNLIKAHAEAWHLYNDKYRATQGGTIGITINSDWTEPRNPYKQEDVDAAKRYLAFFLGWFANPIFKGDYNEIMKTEIRERSLAQGFTQSRLPEFTPDEIQRIKGTYDYFGLNQYTSVLVYKKDYGIHIVSFDGDRGVGSVADRIWLDSGSTWLKVTPLGFRNILKYIKEEYGNPPIYVTENGISERGPIDLNDEHRIFYYENYINQALKAYLLDGVNLRGYTGWTLMDNLEWAPGFEERFGLFFVNRSDTSLPRIPKASVKSYATIVSCNGFPDPSEGPHECLNAEPQGTNMPTEAPPSQDGGAVVSFLGLDVAAPDAEVALYALFALTIVGILAGALLTYQVVKVRRSKKSKHPTEEQIGLENRF